MCMMVCMLRIMVMVHNESDYSIDKNINDLIIYLNFSHS